MAQTDPQPPDTAAARTHLTLAAGNIGRAIAELDADEPNPLIADLRVSQAEQNTVAARDALRPT
jgi:hypothetical protein